MNVRKLLLEVSIILLIASSLIIALNYIQTKEYRNTEIIKLGEKRYDLVYDLYGDKIKNALLIDNVVKKNILLENIKHNWNLGAQIGHAPQSIDTHTYTLNLSPGHSTQLYLYDLHDNISTFLASWPLISLEILIILAAFIYLWSRFQDQLLLSISIMTSHTPHKDFSQEEQMPDDNIQLRNRLSHMTQEIREKAELETINIHAKQVCHDIRSPIACLQLILSEAASLPETERVVMRSAVQRISDIVNTLDKASKRHIFLNDAGGKIEHIMLLPLVESLLNEKRAELKAYQNITISASLESGCDLFIHADPIALRRMLANLINNSIESFNDNKHAIDIILSRDDRFNIVSVIDDGCGIPEKIINNIFNYEFTHGKTKTARGGSGLGLHHAKKSMLSMGGDIVIQSTQDIGTSVQLCFPKAKQPDWFLGHLCLQKDMLVIIIDDDPSIHYLWHNRIKKAAPSSITMRDFHMLEDFISYYREVLSERHDTALFLMDYEFIQQPSNGLETIKLLSIESSSILVTNHHENISLQEQCRRYGISMLPKALVPYVPVNLKQENQPLSRADNENNTFVVLSSQTGASEIIRNNCLTIVKTYTPSPTAMA